VAEPSPIIFFDGLCNLCNGFVQWVIRRDPAGRYRFASLQSEAAKRVLGDPVPLTSVVLWDGQTAWTRSDAALRILRGLGGIWAIFWPLAVVPRALRDGVYEWVARHRYRWFGQRSECLLPTPALRARFLD
jgi:predicted DCC family thiol-disulfide oxidoreductase YuxK